jgi:hypothetical protein
MPSFWDLLPASSWSAQPFVAPFDPTQAATWPMVAPASPPLHDPADRDPLSAAQRAHEFALWAFGPLSGPQVPPMQAAAFTAAQPQDVADADEPAALSATTGNPNIERQGVRARATAAKRPPPPAAAADILPEIYRAGADALGDINAGLNPFSAENRANLEQDTQARTPGETLAAQWEDEKRLARGILGIPKFVAAPITGASRSVLGHGLQWLDGRMRDLAVATYGEDKVRQAEQARGANPGGLTYDQAKQDADRLMWGLAPRGGLRPPARPPASSPMGSREIELDRADFQPSRNLPGTIGNILYSGHAFDQMQNRGLPPSVAEQAMRDGVPSPGKTIERVEYYDPVNRVVVVRDKYTGNVISVFRTRPRGKGAGDDDDDQ